MSVKHLRIFCLVCALVAISSFLVPGAPVNPSHVNAQAGIMRWDTVNTPNSDPRKMDVLNPYIDGNFTGSEIRDISIGSNGTTIIAAVTVDNRMVDATLPPGPLGIVLASNTAGISWSASAYRHLAARSDWPVGNQVFNVLIAPDNPNLWVLTAGTVASGPVELWVTQDGGATWNNTRVPALAVNEAIGAIDISVDYGRGRDLIIVTRTGAVLGAGHIFVTNLAGFTSWVQQVNPSANLMDFFAVRFSPTYNGDQSFVVILATAAGTFYNIGLRDLNNNTTPQWVYPGDGVSVSTPTKTTLSVVDLSLPSDFSGQSRNSARICQPCPVRHIPN